MPPDASLEERLAFLGLGDDDFARLAALRPAIEAHADAFVDSFYGHLMAFEPTRRLLADPAVKRRLLRKQRDYLLSLTDPDFDDDTLARLRRIGEIHVRVGLEPRWYLGAYVLYLNLLSPLVFEFHGHDPVAAQRTLASLVKRIGLDVQLAMEAYVARREAELEHLNRELARLSRGLAKEVQESHDSLRESRQRARAAEELASMATLVAGLAHEVGTPLGVIRGHAEALADVVDGERAQWRVRTIREQIDRIASIIQALLNMARPRESVRVPVDVGGTLDRTLAFVSEKLRRRGVELARDVRMAPSILGDPDKLQQLWLNLILNAVDAMPEGGRLGIRVGPDGPKAVLVRISDTGEGIPEELQERIFEPFYTTKPPGRGSGLGLVVAREIVLDHGGSIEVSSEPGKGTEFRIRLPAAGGKAISAP